MSACEHNVSAVLHSHTHTPMCNIKQRDHDGAYSISMIAWLNAETQDNVTQITTHTHTHLPAVGHSSHRTWWNTYSQSAVMLGVNSMEVWIEGQTPLYLSQSRHNETQGHTVARHTYRPVKQPHLLILLFELCRACGCAFNHFLYVSSTILMISECHKGKRPLF